MSEIPQWLDLAGLAARLHERELDSFAESILALTAQRFDQPTNGDLPRWVDALHRLPDPQECRLDLRGGVRVIEQLVREQPGRDPSELRETLMAFHPWRKGPLEFLGCQIETEWRSDWKWDRVREHLDLESKWVLDVGGGNGYYGWRMLELGAEFVLGFDPILRFVMQFEVFRRYASRPEQHFVVPLLDTDLPEKLAAFDVVFSMGVLYHRTSPIDHLRSLVSALRPGGTLVLETLIIQDDQASVLVPEDRYAQMRNVWFLPSITMLNRWLQRTGFHDIQLVDVTTTTTHEQRSTDWMTFQSLKDFLDPNDPSKTVEGYPAPVRAIVVAKSRS